MHSIRTNVSLGDELPKLKARFDIPSKHIPAFNAALLLNNPGCISCLSRLNLPNAALPELKILRLNFSGYGHQTDSSGAAKVGGSELEVADLDKNLIRLYPVKVDVIAGCKFNEPESQFTDLNGSLTVKTVAGFGTYASITAKLVKLALQNSQYDLIHLHQPFGTSADAICNEARKRGIPLVLSNLNSAEDFSPGSDYKIPSFKKLKDHWKRISSVTSRFEAVKILLMEYIKRVIGRLKKNKPHQDTQWSKTFRGSPLVAVSEHSARAFRGLHTAVIGSPVDTDFFHKSLVSEEDKEALRKNLRLPSSGKIISYHARIVPDKGQDRLIPVAVMLRHKYGSNFHFVLAGTSQSQDYLDNIYQEIKRNNLQDHFTIVPALSTTEVRTLLAISSAFIFPTQHEGLGRSAIEAMLMQVPVVANNVGGIPGYIKDQTTGLLVDKQDTEAMAAGLRRLLTDSQLSTVIIAEAEAYAREHFSASVVARQYMELAYGPLIHSRFS